MIFSQLGRETVAPEVLGLAEMSPYAPRIITTTVPVDKIGEVIGPKAIAYATIGGNPKAFAKLVDSKEKIDRI